MSYALQSVVDAMRREARVGVVGDYTEQYAVDSIGYLNRWASEIYRAWNWDWSKTPISFTLPAGTAAAYTLDAAIGQVIIMGIQGQTGYLRSFTEKEYRKYQKKADATERGTVFGYVKKGRAASGALKVLFVDPPTADTVIEGEGKTVWTKWTAADLVANVDVAYFPDYMFEIITMGAAGTLMTACGDNRGPLQESKAKAAYEALKGEDKSEEADDEVTPPPDMIRFNARNRGGTRVA